MALVAKNPPTNAGDIRDPDSIPGLGRLGVVNGSPLQCSCLGNPMDRGAWQLPSIESQRAQHQGWKAQVLVGRGEV